LEDFTLAVVFFEVPDDLPLAFFGVNVDDAVADFLAVLFLWHF
jgi:hypothetical protein